MIISLMLSAIMASGAPAPQTMFTCRAGGKRIAVTLLFKLLTQDKENLTPDDA